jgi:hypothetical protein
MDFRDTWGKLKRLSAGFTPGRKSPLMNTSRYFLVALLGALFSSLAFAELTLSPNEIEFKDVTQTKKVLITHDDKPVMPGEITRMISGVYKYREIISGSSPGWWM